jgi:cobalt-zinc-cadmium efflux system membrane fusion protein
VVALVLGLALLAGSAVLVLPLFGVPGLPNLLEPWLGKEDTHGEAEASVAVTLVPGQPDTFELEEETVKRMHLPAPLRVADRPRPRRLTLTGNLAFDPDRLGRVQSRFPGEVVELGTSTEPEHDSLGRTLVNQPLRVGNRVKKGQILAVVWSKDLGVAKSDLVDSLSQLKLDEETLSRLEGLYRSGDTSEAVVRQARRNYSASVNAVNRAERALRTWRLPEAEIKAIKDEAQKIITRKVKRDPARERDWARVEVPAPFDGIIVEKNVNLGNIVDTTFDLYKVADLSYLAAYANVYEEDLRELQRLQARVRPGLIPWRLHLAADPDRKALLSDGIKRIGLVIDPNQHTDLVMGLVRNWSGRLKVGQFVTAVVELPAPQGVVSVPAGALDEDGEASFVLVQPDPRKRRYALRRVEVVQRFQGWAYVKSELTAEQKKAGLRELHPGEWVVTEGAVQLRAALEEARARQKSKAQ